MARSFTASAASSALLEGDATTFRWEPEGRQLPVPPPDAFRFGPLDWTPDRLAILDAFLADD